MSKVYRFTCGEVGCAAVSDGGRTMAVRELLPGAPQAELEGALVAQGMGEKIQVGYNVLLLETSENRILVDAGTGRGTLLEGLAELGVAPEQIDYLLVTHGDGDHVGGLEDFPRARIVMPARSWELWTGDATRSGLVEEFVALFRDKASAVELAETADRRDAYGREVLPKLRDAIERVEFEEEFLPGIRFVPAPGHRRDHAAVEVRSAGETLLHTVDAIRHPLQLQNPAWASYIDSDPDQVAVTNRRLFARAAESRALVFTAHLPFPGLGRITATPEAWRWHKEKLTADS